MAILPYMKQLPQDFYKNNFPVTAPIVAAPVVTEPAYQFPIIQEGDVVPVGGGIEEAPTDGRTYAREMAAWTDDWDGGSY